MVRRRRTLCCVLILMSVSSSLGYLTTPGAAALATQAQANGRGAQADPTALPGAFESAAREFGVPARAARGFVQPITLGRSRRCAERRRRLRADAPHPVRRGADAQWQAVQAQEQGGKLPELMPFATMRDTFVQTFNGRPLHVCQSEWESWNRVHGTCRDLVTATTNDQELIAGMTVEFVFYDGVRFQRLNDATTWMASRDEQYDPDLTFEAAFFKINYDATLTQIGPAEVGNIPATQYQFWSRDEALNEEVGGQAIYDLFVSNANRVVSNVFSARGSIPGLGDGTLAQTWVYSDFDAPIVVAPPPFEQVQFASAGMDAFRVAIVPWTVALPPRGRAFLNKTTTVFQNGCRPSPLVPFPVGEGRREAAG